MSIRVEKAKHSSRVDGRKNWLVIDARGIAANRVFVFSSWWNAIREANRLAKTGLVDPYALVAFQSMPSDPARTNGMRHH